MVGWNSSTFSTCCKYCPSYLRVLHSEIQIPVEVTQPFDLPMDKSWYLLTLWDHRRIVTNIALSCSLGTEGCPGTYPGGEGEEEGVFWCFISPFSLKGVVDRFCSDICIPLGWERRLHKCEMLLFVWKQYFYSKAPSFPPVLSLRQRLWSQCIGCQRHPYM